MWGRVVVRIIIPISGVTGALFKQSREYQRLAAALVVAGLAGCVLSSCSKYEVVGVYPEPAPIPLPRQALLTPEPEPGCTAEASGPETHGDLRPAALRHASAAMLAAAGMSDTPRLPLAAASGQSDGAVAQADPNLGLAQRIKLEYERDCFRRAEMRTRERLLKLQQAVAVTARAVKRAEQARP
jgi:hypothetical protein